jgi:hypothetical protein
MHWGWLANWPHYDGRTGKRNNLRKKADLPHGFGGGCEKVRATLPGFVGIIADQPQIGLVD